MLNEGRSKGLSGAECNGGFRAKCDIGLDARFSDLVQHVDIVDAFEYAMPCRYLILEGLYIRVQDAAAVLIHQWYTNICMRHLIFFAFSLIVSPFTKMPFPL